jgi:hypothetical protein
MSQPTTFHLHPGSTVAMPSAHVVEAARTVGRTLLALAVAIVIGASLVAAIVSAQGRFDGTPAAMPAPELVKRERPAPQPPVIETQPTPYPTPAGA